jgi:hypothetical protein
MRQKAHTRLAFLAWTFLTAGSCAHEVKPDDMSAEAHHEKAKQEEQGAQKEAQIARSDWPPNDPMNPAAIPDQYLSQTTEDPKTMHLVRARYLEEHAREHERAAAALEKFEDVECKNLPASKRAACPMLGPIVETKDIDGGVRIRYRDGTDVRIMLPLMRCHYAYARVHGFQDNHDCPLYIRGEEFRAAEPNALDIVAQDPKDGKTVAEIRKRVRADGAGETNQTKP